MKYRSKQEGLSLIGWLVTILLLGLAFNILVKLTPLYANDYSVTSALKKLAKESDLNEKSVGKIRRELQQQFQVNDVSEEASESLEIKRLNEKVLVTVDYERRVSIIGNIDIVLTFKQVLDSASPERCCSAE